jgi:RNA polymerase sigma factor (sigma-70 family)
MSATNLQATLDTLWRMESPKLIARASRMTGDVGAAEELVQEVFAAALERWPRDGTPDNPAAWLMSAAKNRAIDQLRQRQLHARKHNELAQELEEGSMHDDPASDARLEDDIGDDLLRLVFVSCHPVLPREARVALTLRLLCGLSTDEIARAFLQAEPTIAQRIVRAKKTLAQKQVPFAVPRRDELDERLDSVLEVIYLVFNEGYSATAGEDWMRPALCEEALRLGRVLVGLMPHEAEVHGLLALMELQASRTRARQGNDGEAILLDAQDRARWDRLQIERGMKSLRHAVQLGGADGFYALQAAIAARHASALRATDTDWRRIAALYARLAQVAPSPVIELNRAVALSRAEGPQAALPLVEALVQEPQLREYPQLPALRGDLLEQLGRRDEARIEFERAAALTRNARERERMQARAQACITPARDG